MGFIRAPELLTQKQDDVEYQGKWGKTVKKNKDFFILLLQIYLGN